jgi:hypothetical protein
MFQIVFYVPIDQAEKVKESLFAAGAGRLGHYEKCSFETKGIGQFLPLPGSEPFIGRVGEIERVTELKVEMICKKDCLDSAIESLKSSHPYETPAFYVIELVRY